MKSIFKNFPWSTTLLICVMVYVFYSGRDIGSPGALQGLYEDFLFDWSRFSHDPRQFWPTLLTHLFLHADQKHLWGNIIFFLLFAQPVETFLGSLNFLCLYFLWGIAGALTQGLLLANGTGGYGASAAISGAAGAFLVLYPVAKPFTGFPFYLKKGLGQVPAFFLILTYFLMTDIKWGFLILQSGSQITPVGHWAHIGGFLAGALSMAPFIWKEE